MCCPALWVAFGWIVGVLVGAGSRGGGHGVLGRVRRATQRNALLTSTSLVHLTNDACFALLYPLLPFISEDLGLSYTQVGLLKATFSGASSVLQIPTAAVGARYGEQLVLLLGNAWVGVGLAAMALTGTFALLLVVAILAGIGGNAQHPLAASIISKQSAGTRMATALGTLNFAGDLGKLVGPFVAGIVAVQFGWRAALVAVGIPTAIISLALLFGPRYAEGTHAERKRASGDAGPAASGDRRRFRFLLAAGGMDNATRGASLTFLPFILADKGMDAATISAVFAVIFAAGAAGKFGCGWLSDRRGLLAVIVATEVLTAVATLAMLVVDGWLIVPVAIVFGFSANGTSSALNVAVARLIPAARRGSGYGLYFTVALTSSAVAPLAFGAVGDVAGLTLVFMLLALLTVSVIGAALPIRESLRFAK